jgi:hypothetical protein
MQIVARFDDGAITRLQTRLNALAENGRVEMAAALNAAGLSLRRKTVAAETPQTGLAESVIDRAQQTIDASAATLIFTIVARGGSVRLKYFGAKEGGGGVTAHPWGRVTFYSGDFITSGRPGARAASPKLGGHVYTNVGGGKWHGKIKQVRPGLFIPTELTLGKTVAAFKDGGPAALQAIIAHVVAILQ